MVRMSEPAPRRCGRTHELCDAGGAGGATDGALDDGLVQVMASAPSSCRVDVTACRGKNPLPWPLVGCGRVFGLQAARSLETTGPHLQIARVLRPDGGQVHVQRLAERGWLTSLWSGRLAWTMSDIQARFRPSTTR
jgi:hypothetical protein